MKKNLLIVLAIISLICLVSCNKKEGKKPVKESSNSVVEQTTIPKEEQVGTAGSNIPLKDNVEKASIRIEKALMEYFDKSFGREVEDYRIIVSKVYTSEEEQNIPALKERNLGPNEVAFEVSYELKVANGVDGTKFTAGTGVYSEETGWVTEKYNVGIIRPKANNNGQYEITDFGTGF